MNSHDPTQSVLDEVIIPKAEAAKMTLNATESSTLIGGSFDRSLGDGSAKADATEIAFSESANASSPIVTGLSAGELKEEHESVGASEEQKATTHCSADTHIPSQLHISTESRMDDSQAVTDDVSTRQVVTIGRRKKRTAHEQRDLENTVTQETQEGHPIEAIAIRFGISFGAAKNVFVKLVQSGNKELLVNPKYRVVKRGAKVKDLPFLDSTAADFFKVEPHENGVLITPFNVVEDDNA